MQMPADYRENNSAQKESPEPGMINNIFILTIVLIFQFHLYRSLYKNKDTHYKEQKARLTTISKFCIHKGAAYPHQRAYHTCGKCINEQAGFPEVSCSISSVKPNVRYIFISHNRTERFLRITITKPIIPKSNPKHPSVRKIVRYVPVTALNCLNGRFLL